MIGLLLLPDVVEEMLLVLSEVVIVGFVPEEAVVIVFEFVVELDAVVF